MSEKAVRLPGALLAVLWLLAASAAAPAWGQLSPAYQEPDFTSPIFEASRLGLDAPTRRRVAELLAATVTDYDAVLDAKILGVALRLDPASRPALEAAARRRKGELPDDDRRRRDEEHPAGYAPATVAGYLAGQCSGLRAKGGLDNLTLAGYLSAIAAEIDPDNAVVRYEKTACAKACPPPVWTFLKNQPPAARESLPLLKRQSKIRGLGVTELPTGDETGGVIEIIVTAEEARTRHEVGLAVAPGVGASMRTALDEAARAVKLRHPAFGDRQRLALSFGDKYTPKDGPSAGAAFALVLYSLYDPLQLDAACAITGDITVDGRVRKVGAVPYKIHAALLDGCRTVAIPKENADAVADTAFLYPANTLWKLQIFTVDTLDEALAVMRSDRPANLRRAMELFAEAQRLVGLETPRLTAANRAAVPLLKEVLRLAPNHASADFMLRALEGRLPGALSLYASLDEVQRISGAALRAAAPTEQRPEIDQQALADGLNRLETLRPSLDYRIADLCTANIAGLRALQAFDPHQPTPAQIAGYRQRAQAINDLAQRMSSDRALLEALRR